MQAAPAEPQTVEVDADTKVSALLQMPAGARAMYVFAHGAGAGMEHRFMQEVADGLAQRSVAVLRYQFPYLERGSKRVDSPTLAQATVRAAVAHASAVCGGLPLFAGGKSYGGRMTSQAEAEQPLDGLQGLAFIGFPLHPAGKPSVTRARHLASVDKPMLFIQGDRDKLAELPLLEPVVADLGRRARLHIVEAADHGFAVPARSGRTAEQVLTELLDTLTGWIDVISAPSDRAHTTQISGPQE
jgi:uncharacterized protein